MPTATSRSYRYLLSVDPSLTCSGWALFKVRSCTLIGVGKIRSLSATHPLSHRLADLQDKVTGLFEQFELEAGDIVVCEAPTTMRDPSSALKVEQVRTIFETVARSRAIFVPGRINPRTVQHELLGLRGRQLARPAVKHAAQSMVKHLFRAPLEKLGFPVQTDLRRHQDIVDALLIGSLAVDRIRSSEKTGMELTPLFERTSRYASKASDRRKWIASQ